MSSTRVPTAVGSSQQPHTTTPSAARARRLEVRRTNEPTLRGVARCATRAILHMARPAGRRMAVAARRKVPRRPGTRARRERLRRASVPATMRSTSRMTDSAALRTRATTRRPATATRGGYTGSHKAAQSVRPTATAIMPMQGTTAHSRRMPREKAPIKRGVSCHTDRRYGFATGVACTGVVLASPPSAAGAASAAPSALAPAAGAPAAVLLLCCDSPACTARAQALCMCSWWRRRCIIVLTASPPPR